MNRLSTFGCGFLLAVAVAALGATSGGFPSRPRFLSAGVNDLAPSTVGRLQIGATSGCPGMYLANSGSVRGYIGLDVTAANCITGAVANTLSIVNNGPVWVSSDNGATGGLVVSQLSGNATGTIASGCTTTPALTLRWQVQGNIVHLQNDGATCTSNAGTKNSTAALLPAAVRPSAVRECPAVFIDNGVVVSQRLQISSAGTVTWVTPAAAGSFSTLGSGATSSLCSYNLLSI